MIRAFVIFIALLYVSGSNASCEGDMNNWPRALVRFLKSALERELVIESDLQPLASGESWSNPILGRSKDIYNLALRNGVDRALRNIKDEERSAARRAIQDMLNDRVVDRQKTEVARQETLPFLSPEIVVDSVETIGSMQRTGTGAFGWFEGRPIYISRYARQVGSERSDTIMFDPLNPRPIDKHKTLTENDEWFGEHLQPIILNRKKSTYLAILRSDHAYDLKSGEVVDWNTLDLDVPEQRFSNPSWAYRFADLKTAKYLVAWNGRGGQVFKFGADERPKFFFETSKLQLPTFLEVSGAGFLLDVGHERILVRRLSVDAPEIFVERRDNLWNEECATIFEDKGRFFLVYRRHLDGAKWRIVSRDLETGKEQWFSENSSYTGTWNITKIHEVPHLMYNRREHLVVLNLQTMKVAYTIPNQSLDAQSFVVGGVPYILVGPKIIDAVAGGLAMKFPLQLKTTQAHFVTYQGDQYAFLIVGRRPPVFVRLTREPQR